MERMVLEYLVNSLWQAPLVAAAAWLGVRVGKPSARVQHFVWLVVLTAIVGLPAVSMRHTGSDGPQPLTPFADGSSAAAVEAIAPKQGASSVLENSTQTLMQPGARAGVHEIQHVQASWRLPEGATRAVVILYLAMIVFAMARLLQSCYAARRLVRGAAPATLSAVETARFHQCCAELRVSAPEVRRSPQVWGPVVIGVRRPVIVVPETFADDMDAAGMDAVWWHELVHVRRRDYLANLLCRVWALPIMYHPEAHFVLRRVRSTREMVCDAVAAEKMNSRVEYARCLADVAGRAGQAGAAGAGATAMVGDGALEERVMELLTRREKVSAGVRVLRGAIGALSFACVLGAAVLFHVTPTLAEAGRGMAQATAGPDATVEPAASVITRPPAAKGPVYVINRGNSSVQEFLTQSDGLLQLTKSYQIGGPSPSLVSASSLIAAVDAQGRTAGPTNVSTEKGPSAGVSDAGKKTDQLMVTVLSGDRGATQAEMGYLKKLDAAVRSNWDATIPGEAKGPQGRSGVTRIRVKLEPEGKVVSIALAATSGDTAFDKAAWSSLVAGNLPPFPEEIHGDLELGAQFFYNYAGESLTGWESGVEKAIAKPQGGDANTSDKDLYAHAMGAKASGSFETERMVLQTLINLYPNSEFVIDAKRAIAQSWDAQGTLALMHAEDEYQAAGVAPKKLGNGITPPMLITQVEPEFTSEARAAKLSGAVLVNLWVDEQGDVQHVRVMRGLGSGLDEKAIDAARQYKFRPAIENGKPVMVALNIEVNFRIF